MARMGDHRDSTTPTGLLTVLALLTVLLVAGFLWAVLA